MKLRYTFLTLLVGCGGSSEGPVGVRPAVPDPTLSVIPSTLNGSLNRGVNFRFQATNCSKVTVTRDPAVISAAALGTIQPSVSIDGCVAAVDNVGSTHGADYTDQAGSTVGYTFTAFNVDGKTVSQTLSVKLATGQSPACSDFRFSPDTVYQNSAGGIHILSKSGSLPSGNGTNFRGVEVGPDTSVVMTNAGSYNSSSDVGFGFGTNGTAIGAGKAQEIRNWIRAKGPGGFVCSMTMYVIDKPVSAISAMRAAESSQLTVPGIYIGPTVNSLDLVARR